MDTRRFLSCCKPINKPIHHTGRRAVDDDRASNGEHLGPDAQDEALCLCQVRTKFLQDFSIIEKLFVKIEEFY